MVDGRPLSHRVTDATSADFLQGMMRRKLLALKAAVAAILSFAGILVIIIMRNLGFRKHCCALHHSSMTSKSDVSSQIFLRRALFDEGTAAREQLLVSWVCRAFFA